LSVLAMREDETPIIMATIEWPMWASKEKAAQIRMWRDQATQ